MLELPWLFYSREVSRRRGLVNLERLSGAQFSKLIWPVEDLFFTDLASVPSSNTQKSLSGFSSILRMGLFLILAPGLAVFVCLLMLGPKCSPFWLCWVNNHVCESSTGFMDFKLVLPELWRPAVIFVVLGTTSLSLMNEEFLLSFIYGGRMNFAWVIFGRWIMLFPFLELELFSRLRVLFLIDLI